MLAVHRRAIKFSLEQRRMHVARFAVAGTLCALGCCLGCSSSGPTTHTVTGTITYNGKPVANAQVGFVATDASAEVKSARGQTDADGKYSLSTYLGPGDDVRGAMAGSYKVTVVKGLAEDRIVSYEELAQHQPEIPPRYADTVQTPLTAEVTPDGDNTFDFALIDEP
jgi:hypothetical protein